MSESEPFKPGLPEHVALWVVMAGILVIALAGLTLWKIPEWQIAAYPPSGSTDAFQAQNQARAMLLQIITAMAQIVAGGAFLVTLWFSYQTLRLNQNGQLTDRFIKATEQLGALGNDGKPKLDVRLGAIYSLERLAADSPRDRIAIVEVLAAYVRQHAPRTDWSDASWSAPAAPADAPVEDIEDFWAELTAQREHLLADEREHLKRLVASSLLAPMVTPTGERVQGLPADVQAAITVLGRSRGKYEELNRRGTFYHLQLMATDLRGADLRGADLAFTDLSFAQLTGAVLRRCSLRGASLCRADLTGLVLADVEMEAAQTVLRGSLDKKQGFDKMRGRKLLEEGDEDAAV